MKSTPRSKSFLHGDITEKILEAAFEVSKELGSGFAVTALAPEHSAQTIIRLSII